MCFKFKLSNNPTKAGFRSTCETELLFVGAFAKKQMKVLYSLTTSSHSRPFAAVDRSFSNSLVHHCIAKVIDRSSAGIVLSYCCTIGSLMNDR